ncbi:hypothetical protein [Solobacterium sp.]|uniref:hypothetical protein n=1 Tax=Solobacterium sp. TaxID=2060878 RepID=UPI001CAE9AE7|nr:hypothetical protein [Solobacterium sp.]MBF1099322.1 hypothetical protein [Solobacterium sp.]
MDIFRTKEIGHVVRIISKTRLIVDLGVSDLTVGDSVLIFSQGDELYDLENNSLGTYEFVKDTLTVIETAEKYSVCAKQINGSLSAILNNSINFTRTEEADLNINKLDIVSLQVFSSPQIKLGDLVRKC